MKCRRIFYFAFFLAAIGASLAFIQRSGDPWKPSQLLAPADLAQTINSPAAKQPIIYSIGPGAVIKNSVDIGPTQQRENLHELEKHLAKLSKDTAIVIYCGCCPFDKCPNVRPAFTLLNNMHFTNHKLLNLTQNIKTNWIDHGYPVAD